VYNTGKYTSQARDYSDGIRIANEQADLNGGDPTPGVYNINVKQRGYKYRCRRSVLQLRRQQFPAKLDDCE